MPVYQLPRAVVFPDPREADASGLIAVGGDLSPLRLMTGYSCGIFPWYEEPSPILWFSPDPRAILEPSELKVSRSLRKTLRHKGFEVRADTAFAQVLEGCAGPRVGLEEGTWLGPQMRRAYQRLFQMGLAHSIETYFEGKLVGGLYGVHLGRAFFGESMFSRMSDASKVAFVAMVAWLKTLHIGLIDCQLQTEHLKTLGVRTISRDAYLERLVTVGCVPLRPGRWTFDTSILGPYARGEASAGEGE